ncbi:MAG: NAD-dependent epimerase/dehydratase family protein [Nitrososphaera sp.]
MSKSTVLVTGVAGFLGSNLLERLLSEGHSVVGIDNLSMGRLANIEFAAENDRFRFIKDDAMNASVFQDIAEDIDVAVHLAAFKIPRYGKAINTLKINYYCTENVLELARDRNIKCVLASTSDVYGRNPDIPFSEERTDSVIGSSLSPRWAYAVSKLFDEHLALAYQDAYGFPVTLLRFFGSYGPRQPLSWWGGPPPVFINAVLKDEVIPIHGDGMQTRSFTYVSDTINGIYAAMFRDAANGEILNIGNDEEVTILELAKRVKIASGTPGELKIEFVPYESFSGKKYEDVMRRVPDTSHSEKVLGVKPVVPLDEGLRKTIEWQRQALKELGDDIG